jgi:hypothetical protein
MGPDTFALQSDGRQVQRAARMTRAMHLQAAAALVLLCAAVGLERWGLQRELDQIQVLRNGLRLRANAAVSAWDSAQSAVNTVSEIVRLESTRSNWSGLLLDVAEQLPDSTRLLAFQGQQDTMTLELSAPDAVAALESLKEKPSFAQLQIVGSIQRREQENSNTTDHFVVAVPLHQVRSDRPTARLPGRSR